jgi:UDP-glucose 4-epimerase
MILLTGANGFIGRALAAQAIERGLEIRCAVRSNSPSPVDEKLNYRIDSISVHQDWSPGLVDVDTVIHTAARVHIMHDTEFNPLLEFRKVNTSGTLHLAKQASENGVNRFIFLSSAKVNGECSTENHPFTEESDFVPVEPYALSKYEAEKGLLALSEKSDMEVVILRPPLVYGPGVGANFLNMMRWIDRGLPLPLAAIDNKRSLVALDNLVDLIIGCIEHPAAANRIFLASDGEDVSTTDLLRAIGEALHRPARLFPCPASLLALAATLLGKKGIVQRLTGSLQLDISRTRRLLEWEPPLTLAEGMRRVAQDFKQRSSS